MLWIMPLKNYKRTYSNSVVLFIQQNVFFDKKGFCVVSSTVLWCNPAGSVAVSGCSSRPLSVNEFWEMLSEIRSPAVCRREMLSSTAAFTKTNPAPRSSVCLPVTTIRENETSSGSDYAPSHRTCHLSPFSTDTRVKEEEEEEKSRCAWTGKKERRMKKCVQGPIKTPLWDPFPPCSCKVITITTPHSALSKRLSDTSLPPYLSSHTPSTPPSGIASLPPSPDSSLDVSDMSESWAVSSI